MGRMKWGSSLVAVLACVLIFAATASAANSVFWSNFEGKSLGHAALTGGGSLITPTPMPAEEPYGSGIDAATGKIYWGDTKTDTIMEANLDGSGSAVLPTGAAALDQPNSTVVDLATGRVYWANAFNDTISWASLEGGVGGQIDTGTAPMHTPYGLAVDPAAGRLYWANYEGKSIGYANLDGSGGGGELELPTGLADATDGLAIDAATGRIYWTNYSEGTIGWANLSGVGSGLLSVSPNLVAKPTGIAVDPEAGRIYWANEGEDEGIYSAALDGSGAVALDTSGAAGPGPSYPSLLKAPVSATAPTITGVGSLGSVLTCKAGNWAGDLVESQLYRVPRSTVMGWTLNGAPVAGATGTTLTVSQPGSYACQVTATNGAGSTTATSAPITVAAPVAPAPSIKVTKVKYDKKNGTATILTGVSGPGKVTLSGKQVVRDSVHSSGVGIAKLKVIAKGKSLKTLKKTGKAKLKVALKFVTTEGGVAQASPSITLRLKL